MKDDLFLLSYAHKTITHVQVIIVCNEIKSHFARTSRAVSLLTGLLQVYHRLISAPPHKSQQSSNRSRSNQQNN